MIINEYETFGLVVYDSNNEEPIHLVLKSFLSSLLDHNINFHYR